MEFSWNPAKAKLNLKKHKVSFEEAVTAFYDPLAKIAHDPDHSNEEDRFLLIGHSQKSHLLFIVHLYKDHSDTVRIISARKATKKEARDFKEV